MTDTSGPTSREPLAHFDPASSSWRTSQGTFPLGLGESSLTLPPWGMTRAGALYALPTPVRATSERDCSVLPTPRSQNGETRNSVLWERPLVEPQNLENALARLPNG